MRRRMIAFLAFTMLASAPGDAQKSEDIVRWTAKAPPAAVRPGGTAAVELKAEIEAGWYMYALTQLEGGPPPLEIALAKGQPFTLDPRRIDAPLPGITKGIGGEPDSFHYDDKVTLTVAVDAAKTVKPGKRTVSIEVTYQVCSGSICLRPAVTTLPVALTVR